jgi:hypothetical protein
VLRSEVLCEGMCMILYRRECGKSNREHFSSGYGADGTTVLCSQAMGQMALLCSVHKIYQKFRMRSRFIFRSNERTENGVKR